MALIGFGEHFRERSVNISKHNAILQGVVYYQLGAVTCYNCPCIVCFLLLGKSTFLRQNALIAILAQVSSKYQLLDNFS